MSNSLSLTDVFPCPEGYSRNFEMVEFDPTLECNINISHRDLWAQLALAAYIALGVIPGVSLLMITYQKKKRLPKRSKKNRSLEKFFAQAVFFSLCAGAWVAHRAVAGFEDSRIGESIGTTFWLAVLHLQFWLFVLCFVEKFYKSMQGGLSKKSSNAQQTRRTEMIGAMLYKVYYLFMILTPLSVLIGLSDNKGFARWLHIFCFACMSICAGGLVSFYMTLLITQIKESIESSSQMSTASQQSAFGAGAAKLRRTAFILSFVRLTLIIAASVACLVLVLSQLLMPPEYDRWLPLTLVIYVIPPPLLITIYAIFLPPRPKKNGSKKWQSDKQPTKNCASVVPHPKPSAKSSESTDNRSSQASLTGTTSTAESRSHQK